MPHISGSEITGEVAALGEAVTGLVVGQRVAIAPWLFDGTCEFCLRGDESLCLKGDIIGLSSQGGYAEYVSVPAINVVPLPATLSFEDAASLTLAAITAWRMLVHRARVRPGEDVLVLGAGSGVGSAAIQIARLMGARVIATASGPAKLQRARALGADDVIYWTRENVRDEVRRITGKRGVDVVVEHVGQSTLETSLAVLARGGRLVTCGATTGDEGEIDIWTLFNKEISVIGSTGGTRHDLRTVLTLAAQGRLRPVIERTFPLDQAADAQRLMESREHFGKIVLLP